MSLVGIRNITIDSNVRTIPGVEDLNAAVFEDLPLDEQATIQELADSIAEWGLIQPIAVKELKAGKFRLIAGWRRLMAHKRLGKTSIDVKSIKGKKDDEYMIKLIENVQREDLNPLDIARALEEIRITNGFRTQDAISKRIGKSSGWVSQHMGLLKMAPEVQVSVERGEMSLRAARELSSLPKVGQAEALGNARREAEASGDVDKKTGKPKVKAKGARRQARRSKKSQEERQLSIRPVVEREQEQKDEFIAEFIDDNFGQKKVSSAQRDLVGKVWDYLMSKGRLIIK